MLLEARACVDIVDADGRTALHMAAGVLSLDARRTVQTLLDARCPGTRQYRPRSSLCIKHPLHVNNFHLI